MGVKKTGNLSKANGFDVFNYIIMGLFAIVTLFPFYYVLIISLADEADVHKQPIYLIPTSINLESYRYVLKADLFVNAFFVSVFITVVGTVLAILFSTAAAYALSKKYIPGHRFMFLLIIIPMFFSGGLIPYYLTIQKIGLMNNIFVLIIPVIFNGFYLILLKNFFEDLPQSIEESAKIDGANDIYILYKIVIPTSAPVIATISLFYAVDRWNEYFAALMYISNTKFYPLQLVLREITMDFKQIMRSNIGAEIARSEREVYTKGLQMAVITVATIPIICVYPFLQKYFTKGIMFGAVKE